MQLDKFSQSKTFRTILLALGIAIILLLVFKAGEFVEYKKAAFSYKWAENYEHNFGSPQKGFFHDIDDRMYTSAHGTSGTILKIEGATLTLKQDDNTEKTVVLSDQTTIRKQTQTVKPADLKVDDQIVCIGSPNTQGQIEAKFIRVF